MLQKRLLIVMADGETSRFVWERLEKQTMKVDYAASLSKGLEYAMKRDYCLLMVDLQMPDIASAEMVRIFRIAKHMPILALTNALPIQEKIELFHAGVDVFLEKPIDADICAAQASALIELYLESDEEVKKSVPVAFGTSLVIAPRYRQVLIQGAPLELTRIEFNLLYFMAKHPGQVFSRRELYQYVWDDYYELGGDETVKWHIKELRKKLAMLGRSVIETVWGVGYRFIPPE